MTFEFAHNFLRKLMNLEGGQLSFLTEAQKDNFYANPHTFFIRADDETARAIWHVLYPKPKEPAAGEKRGNVIWPRDWLNRESVDFEYDTGRVYPLPAPVTSGGAKSTTPHDTWSAGYYDRAS